MPFEERNARNPSLALVIDFFVFFVICFICYTSYISLVLVFGLWRFLLAIRDTSLFFSYFRSCVSHFHKSSNEEIINFFSQDKFISTKLRGVEQQF